MSKGKSKFGAYGWYSTNEEYLKIKVSTIGVLQTN